LTRHAEVPDERRVVVERQPEVLAPPPGAHDRATGELGGEVERAGHVPAYRARMQHLYRLDPAAGDPFVQAQPHRFDLG
jgi:hypothetical protein